MFFFKYWSKMGRLQCPSILINYLEATGIDIKDPVKSTMEAIERHFDLFGISRMDQKKFSDRYIYKGKLAYIKRAYQRIGYLKNKGIQSYPPSIKLLINVLSSNS